MRLNNIINEDFNVVSIKGILRNLSNDEKAIYKRIRRHKDGKLFKNEIDDFMLRVANNMVGKGLLGRRKNPQGEIYFICKGRRKNMNLNNIYENYDKKLIQEDWEYLNLKEKLEFIMSKGDTPLHYTMFKSPQDIINLCPEGSFFYRFNDDDTVDSLYQIMKYKDDKAYIRTIKYGLRNMLFDLDLNTLFKNIKNCSIIPIKFNG